MTKATELAQLGGLVEVTGTGNATKVGIGGSGIVIIAYPTS